MCVLKLVAVKRKSLSIHYNGYGLRISCTNNFCFIGHKDKVQRFILLLAIYVVTYKICIYIWVLEHN